jgi:glucokinase
MAQRLALGIDIGGTNTEYGIVDQLGKVCYENSIPTAGFLQPKDLVEAIYEDLKNRKFLKKISGIGIGAPNGNHFTGNIEFAPNLLWKGVIPLAQMFESKFEILSRLTNDANAAALGEMLFGNAQDVSHFVTITLGTGLGSGVVIDGKIVSGSNGFAGEYGHIRIQPDGRLCGCGRRGCLETYVSATGIVRSLEELNRPSKKKSSLSRMTNVTARDVFEQAREGDSFAKELIEYTATVLGSSLADFACFSNPQVFVLFGGIARNCSNFAERVKIHFESNCLSIFKDKIEIRTSTLHDKNAAILGAAASVFNELN